MWIAERARQIDLQAAGDHGTYFQFFPLEPYRTSSSSPDIVDGKVLRMGLAFKLERCRDSTGDYCGR